jgi:BirA family biotin operon repressor/biotin-[acetyl-CoA-carboxylase] ligase
MAILGSSIHRFNEVSSTNDVARNLAASGESEGTVVMALSQTSGRGTQGRAWSSPRGEGLYVSVILRPRLAPAAFSIITLAAAVAVAEALSNDFGLETDIKWPNDILADGRKICGILVESASEGEKIEYAIAGIGINLRQRSFPAELRQSATSFLLETGREVPPDEMVDPLMGELERWYRLSMTDPDRVLNKWQELSSFAVNCPVTVSGAGGIIRGITRGLTSRGALKIQLGTGEPVEIFSGEVRKRV